MDGPRQDQHLVGRIAAGDPSALEALYDQHANVLFALLVRIVADRHIAEELLQEAFLRVWQHAGTYDGSLGSVRPWLLGIAHNLALNELRRRRRRPQQVAPQPRGVVGPGLDAIPDPGPEPSEVAWAAARRARLDQALDRLPIPQRAVIALYAAGHSQSEIAARLGEPLGTVKSRMRRGLRQLREILRDEGLDVE